MDMSELVRNYHDLVMQSVILLVEMVTMTRSWGGGGVEEEEQELRRRRSWGGGGGGHVCVFWLIWKIILLVSRCASVSVVTWGVSLLLTFPLQVFAKRGRMSRVAKFPVSPFCRVQPTADHQLFRELLLPSRYCSLLGVLHFQTTWCYFSQLRK